MTIKEYKELPTPLANQLFERNGALFLHGNLPVGARSRDEKDYQIMMAVGIIIIMSFLGYSTVARIIENGIDINALYVFMACSFFGLFIVAFIFWERHLGTLRIDGTPHVWPKKGANSINDGNMVQGILGALLMFFFLGILSFFSWLLVNILCALCFLSWAYYTFHKTPYRIELSKPYYLPGDQLDIPLEQIYYNTSYAMLVNFTTVRLKQGRRYRKRKEDFIKINYVDWKEVDENMQSVSFKIPEDSFVATDFSQRLISGWVVCLCSDRSEIAGSPYLIPIFDTPYKEPRLTF